MNDKKVEIVTVSSSKGSINYTGYGTPDEKVVSTHKNLRGYNPYVYFVDESPPPRNFADLINKRMNNE